MFQNSISIIVNPKGDLWDRCVETIKNQCQTDPLFQNYIGIIPESYYHFVSAVYNDEIISFGAIQYSPSKWGEQIARVLTRFWIHPNYRSQGLTKWGHNNIRFSPLILKPQIDFLKQQNKIKVAMITREGKYKKSFKEISRLASTVSVDPFEISDKIYNVCGDSNDPSCYQMISLSSVDGSDKWTIFSSAYDQGHFKGLRS